MVNSIGEFVNSDPMEIVTNIDRTFTKFMDLDVDCQMHSALYGMEFGIRSVDGELLFYGKWTPCIIANNLWSQIFCFSDRKKCLLEHSPDVELTFSVQSTTILANITWARDDVITYGNTVLKTLKEKVESFNRNYLAIRITLHSYKYRGNRANIGRVEGVIGIPSDDDTLCIPGKRIMLPVSGTQPKNLDYDICDECKYKGQIVSQDKQWMGPAPFKINILNENKAAEILVDFSSSLVMDNDKRIRDIKTLKLAVCDGNYCNEYIGEFSNYLNETTYTKNSGIYRFKVEGAGIVIKLLNNPLAVVQSISKVDPSDACDIGQQEPVNVKAAQDDTDVVLLKEHEYFIRPKGYYVGRLDITNPTNTQEVYITRYGIPAANVTPTVHGMLNPELSSPLPTIPPNGVVGKLQEYRKDEGIATFKFRKNTVMPLLRNYGQPICEGDDRFTIPIDGQVYFFYYSIDGNDDEEFRAIQTVFLSHSDVRYTRPYTWVNDVGPIFTQYARLTPVMKSILDLSNYRDVAKPHNLNLLRKNFKLDFNDPAYMPTTRDLSPTKRAMILEWLQNPLYDHQCQLPSILGKSGRPFKYDITSNLDHSTIPDIRCDGTKAMQFNHTIYLNDSILFSVFNLNEDHKCYHLQKKGINDEKSDSVKYVFREGPKLGDRPLLRTGEPQDIELSCNKSSVARQLQTALQLEWATIPTYLTTLYSIPNGCNAEIYNLIRSIVMQEMFHFALVGNLLIALGEVPEIDSPNFAPSYPGPLPGCVLPGLNVTLQKFTLDHIKNMFMMIELPTHTEVVQDEVFELFTIGAFYDEIKSCIEYLDDNIFDPSTKDFQVRWHHWNPNSIVGTLNPITDKQSALEAIETIVSQGEGSGLLNPKDIEDKTYAHFFKFEEIYCGHHLKHVSKNPDMYSYSGHPIFFDPNGVAPMRPDPTTKDLPKDTVCYTESRVFHDTYRNFLRKLQEVFNGKNNGKPEDIFVAIELMEALQLIGKRLMWIDFDGFQTCGPVWDYNF